MQGQRKIFLQLASRQSWHQNLALNTSYENGVTTYDRRNDKTRAHPNNRSKQLDKIGRSSAFGPSSYFSLFDNTNQEVHVFQPSSAPSAFLLQPSSQIPELHLLTPSISGSFRSSPHARRRIYRRWPQGQCLLNFIKHLGLTLLD